MKFLTRVFALIGVALLVGLAHSALEPVMLRLPDLDDEVHEARPDPKEEAETGADEPDAADGPEREPEEGDPEPEGEEPEGEEEPSRFEAPEPGDEPRADGERLGRHLSLEQTRRLHERALRGEVVFVDARTEEKYVEGHILGAYHLTPRHFRTGDLDVLGMYSPDTRFVVYCGGGDCAESENVVIRLHRSGFERAHIFTDGYPAWVEAGYETATGDDPWGDG